MSQPVRQTVAVIGFISTLLVGLALLIIVGVGAAYNPDKGQLYLWILLGGIFILAATAFVLLAKGIFGKIIPRGLEMSVVIFGLTLALYGMYLVATDFGDILLYVWLVPMGASLAIVAYDVPSLNKEDV